ncbi:cation:proton antiporter [Swingsia samuiensis]|uniref:Sodium:proton antiporter n=1 Tax=Swingsia samuiensis TaxID=1293412 RepID=A0A4Y6ULV8_9PROT|nr:sodium:proton antiporter [Swingsia samuiensis]QDH17317.1 sodium:proton antiporter [Swingsia samuiensis]
MDTIDLIALLLVLSSLFAIINDRTLRLPMTIGILLFSLLTSLFILVLNPFIPAYDLQLIPRSVLGAINLPKSLLNGALSFLLFAGGMQVDLKYLKEKLASIAALSLLGTILAVALLAYVTYGAFALLHHPIPLSWCIVLGAILAPTDPVSVVGMLKRLGLPAPLQAIFAGESLFNDGVGVVIFGVTLGLATGESQNITLSHLALSFCQEAIGGGILGAIIGWIALQILRLTQDTHTQLLISLALATATFSIANHFEMSGAIAVVIAGMSLGTRYAHKVINDQSRHTLDTAWSLLEEILNIFLFLLIGFEILEITPTIFSILTALIVIPLSLISRSLSVFLSTLPTYLRNWDRGRMFIILTWGGLRGGISIALALGLPPGPLRDFLLPICYGVVIFTILVQGLTMERVARKLYPKNKT